MKSSVVAVLVVLGSFAANAIQTDVALEKAQSSLAFLKAKWTLNDASVNESRSERKSIYAVSLEYKSLDPARTAGESCIVANVYVVRELKRSRPRIPSHKGSNYPIYRHVWTVGEPDFHTCAE